jgi:hypothetical protein
MEAKGRAEARVNLLTDLEEFVTDHNRHGPLTADATEPAPGTATC